LFLVEGTKVALSEAWLQQVIEREIEGAELVVLEELGNRRQRILRLYIDCSGGVTHELCSRVSAAVGEALDQSDAIDGPYILEVSSPGLERPLRKQQHFEAQLGKKVYVKTRVLIEGAKVRQGILSEVGTEQIVIREEGCETSIPLAEISSAHLIYEFK
jgi:ribosome maturation factor RimP